MYIPQTEENSIMPYSAQPLVGGVGFPWRVHIRHCWPTNRKKHETSCCYSL